MPEHVALEYDQAGKCPLCGMTLVPVSRETLAQIQPGGRVEYYTCPMPEHRDVRETKPGKCPRCGMTLIPVMSPPSERGSVERDSVGASATLHAPDAPRSTTPPLYTCPMASHADVVSDKPGKCPKCEMELVPASSVSHGKVSEENWRKQHPAGP